MLVRKWVLVIPLDPVGSDLLYVTDWSNTLHMPRYSNESGHAKMFDTRDLALEWADRYLRSYYYHVTSVRYREGD